MPSNFRSSRLRTYVAASLVVLAGIATSAEAAPFNSGSTGADGAFKPAANVELTLPDNGIFNFTDIDIPAGVKVTFRKNAANTPVVFLTSGSVKIAGVIDISGGNSAPITVGSAFVTDGGSGGPGGYQGGRGSLPASGALGGTGHGPGGGKGGKSSACNSAVEGGGGAGFGSDGGTSVCVSVYAGLGYGQRGWAYGAASALPLIGGSGGGGGAGHADNAGAGGTGGGGGGGAMLIVSTGSVDLSGSIVATGGASGAMLTSTGACDGTSYRGGIGGGGSGGAVRILAPAFSGKGTIDVSGGAAGNKVCPSGAWNLGGNGGFGRSSVEIVSSGTFNFGDIPTLSIVSIADQVIASPDVILPLVLPNPAPVVIKATGVPTGTVATLTLSLPYGPNVAAQSSPFSGSYASSTATASIAIPYGKSTLTASARYTLTLAQGEALAPYAAGERVEKVELAATLGGASTVTLITVSGRAFEVSSAVLAVMPS